MYMWRLAFLKLKCYMLFHKKKTYRMDLQTGTFSHIVQFNKYEHKHIPIIFPELNS